MIKFFPNGSRFYYNSKGYVHRTNSPAMIYREGNSWKNLWYLNGIIHRDDGPAIENSSGYKEYWYYGNKINVESTEDFIRYIKLLAFI